MVTIAGHKFRNTVKYFTEVFFEKNNDFEDDVKLLEQLCCMGLHEVARQVIEEHEDLSDRKFYQAVLESIFYDEEHRYHDQHDRRNF